MGSMASSRNRMDRRDRKARRRRYGMRVNDSARKLAMIRAARLRPGAPDSSLSVAWRWVSRRDCDHKAH